VTPDEGALLAETACSPEATKSIVTLELTARQQGTLENGHTVETLSPATCGQFSMLTLETCAMFRLVPTRPLSISRVVTLCGTGKTQSSQLQAQGRN